MIADASLSNAFDDLADLFLGGSGPAAPTSSPSSSSPTQTAQPGAGNHHAAAPLPPAQNGASASRPAPLAAASFARAKPIAVEGLILGHLPMMASLWAGQYPRMAAAADNGTIALVRLDPGTARVELFHPPRHNGSSGASRIGLSGNGTSNHERSLPDRSSPDLAGALNRAAQVASRIVVYSSLSADERLLARSPVVRSMALLTGADDASAVGAYKALKRLAVLDHDHDGDDETAERSANEPRSLLFRIAVMGSEESRATAAFHRLSDAAKSFLSLPIEFAGHCRQIAGGVPGTILFEGPSAMTTQAILEALSSADPQPERNAAGDWGRPSRPPAATTEPRPSPSGPTPAFIRAAQPGGAPTLSAQPLAAAESEQPVKPLALVKPPLRPHIETEAKVIPIPLPPLPTHTDLSSTPLDLESAPRPPSPPPPPPAPLPSGITPLPIRCPFDRDPILAIDGDGVPQVATAAASGHSSEAAQRLLAVGAWLWTNRELLALVCPTLRVDVRPVLHLITDHPTDVNRLIDSDLRLHIRIPPAATSGTLPLN